MQPIRGTCNPMTFRLYVSRAATDQSAPRAFGRTARGANSCVIW